jgi:hypothetical protein
MTADSLALAVLQNLQGFDFLTTTQGGLCLYLQEECFYANESKVLQETLTQIQK